MWTDYVVKKILALKGDHLKDYFDDLELEVVIPKLLQYFYDENICENVVWILKEEFDGQFLTQENVTAEPGQSMYQHVKIHTLKPSRTSDIDKLCRYFDPTTAAVQEKSIDNKVCVLAPIQGVKHKAPVAYLLFIDVRAGQADKLKKRLSRDLTPMAKHISFSLQHWAVQKLSFMDDLTALYNQKYMSMVLENEIYRCQRDKGKFSVLFMDIDYFKSVNDTRGHLVGSRLLVELGHILKNGLRRSDYAFRYGGDEFVVVLPGTDSIGAQVAAERLRHTVEKTEFLVEGQNINLTLSIGLATYPDHAKTHKDIIKMADEAMYCGKNKSRNIVFVAS